MIFEAIQGDITQFQGDAIVNAANGLLLGGGGVDGAIHRAAGPELREACRAYPADAQGHRCRTGQALLTPGFNLPARWIIHTVGPIFDTPTSRGPCLPGEMLSQDPYRELVGSLNACFRLAVNQGIRTIALPAISCGVFGCTIETFAKALHEVLIQRFFDQAWGFEQVTLVLFSELDLETFQAAWEALFPE